MVKGLVSKGELDQSINKLRGDLEKNMKGLVKTGDLTNLQVEMVESMGNMDKKLETNMGNMEKLETNIGNMEKKLEESMKIIVNLIQHPEEKLPNDDNVGQDTHDERNSSHF